MRAVLATAVAALAVAAPAGAVSIPKGISFSLSAQLSQQKAAQDRTRTCQAGTRKTATQHTTVVGNASRPAVVACEQPPKSSLVTPDSIAKATAAAIAVLG